MKDFNLLSLTAPKELESYYLGTKYLVLEVPSDGVWVAKVYQTLFAYDNAKRGAVSEYISKF